MGSNAQLKGRSRVQVHAVCINIMYMHAALFHQLRRPCQDEVAQVTAVLAAANARSRRAANAQGRRAATEPAAAAAAPVGAAAGCAVCERRRGRPRAAGPTQWRR